MKRKDLQGIRGLAILFVLIFHLKPTEFRFGFVGVDMFFVLSGYLMSMILGRKEANLANFLDFYKRRFIRIVPIYYVILTSIYAGCWFLLLAADKKQLISDLHWGLSFTSNIQPLFDNTGYWDKLSSYRFLTHSWSLGVELQFYVLAPFLLGRFACQNHFSRRFVLYTLAVASLIYQLYSSEHHSHGLLTSRIWQFLCGALAFDLTTTPSTVKICPSVKIEVEAEDGTCPLLVEGSEKQPEGTKTSPPCVIAAQSAAITVLLCLVGLGTEKLSDTVVRIAATMTTAFLTAFPCHVLGNSILAYIGNISYSLYLIHWPLIVAVKYYLDVETLSSEIFLLVPLIIGVTAIFYHTIENLLCRSKILASVLISVFCCLMVLSSNNWYTNTTFMGFNSHITTDFSKINKTEVIRWNTAENYKVYFPIPCLPDSEGEKWTNMKEEPQLRCIAKGNGTAKVLILGNSIAYRAYPLIHSILDGQFSELRLFSRSSCPPLSDFCGRITTAAKVIVDKMRPDILMHMHVMTDDVFVRPIIDLKTDPMFLSFQHNLDYFKARSTHVVIDLPYFVYKKGGIGNEIASRLQKNITVFDDLKVSREEDLAQEQYHRARIQQLSCSNCIINPINEALFSGDSYWLYNRSSLHSISADGTHLTTEGLNLVRPTYEKILRKLLRKLEKRK